MNFDKLQPGLPVGAPHPTAASPGWLIRSRPRSRPRELPAISALVNEQKLWKRSHGYLFLDLLNTHIPEFLPPTRRPSFSCSFENVTLHLHHTMQLTKYFTHTESHCVPVTALSLSLGWLHFTDEETEALESLNNVDLEVRRPRPHSHSSIRHWKVTESISRIWPLSHTSR